MKKLCALSLLVVAAFGWSAQPASAWWPWYPLCCNKGCCRNTCCASITLRQYNAFTPICCGNMSCDGCCPMNLNPCGQAVCGPALFGCCPPSCGPMGCSGSSCYAGCGDGCALGQLPAPGAIAPPSAAPGYQAPAPTPMEGARPMSSSWNPYTMPYATVQPAAYRPMYNPAYPMMPSAPNPVQAPYYWNMGR